MFLLVRFREAFSCCWFPLKLDDSWLGVHLCSETPLSLLMSASVPDSADHMSQCETNCRSWVSVGGLLGRSLTVQEGYMAPGPASPSQVTHSSSLKTALSCQLQDSSVKLAPPPPYVFQPVPVVARSLCCPRTGCLQAWRECMATPHFETFFVFRALINFLSVFSYLPLSFKASM